MAEAGYNPIIGVGFAYSDAVDAVSQEYPDISFAVVDGFATRQGRELQQRTSPTSASPRTRAPSSSASPPR